jgi:hypothetical protein
MARQFAGVSCVEGMAALELVARSVPTLDVALTYADVSYKDGGLPLDASLMTLPAILVNVLNPLTAYCQ